MTAPGGGGRLTTHVLDVSRGVPAAGMHVRLWRLSADAAAAPSLLRTGRTNADGRLDCPLLEGAGLAAGAYELEFEVGDYFRRTLPDASTPAFLEAVPVRFVVADPAAHYHVPLLVAPGGYSTYRGS